MYNKHNGLIVARPWSNIMDNFFSNDFRKTFFDQHRNDFNIPPVNILEHQSGYELQVVAPGLQKEDFKIHVEKDVLTVSFEKKEEANTTANEGANKWLHREYKAQAFKRSFNLSEKVSTEGISAQYTNGVLSINLPKKEVETPKTIQVSVQ